TFYHFFDFPQYAEKRVELLELLKTRNIKGSLLIAAEGINGTIAGQRDDIDAALAYIKERIICGPFEHKESHNATQPFTRTKVRLKKETISLGEPCPPELVGKYVTP